MHHAPPFHPSSAHWPVRSAGEAKSAPHLSGTELFDVCRFRSANTGSGHGGPSVPTVSGHRYPAPWPHHAVAWPSVLQIASPLACSNDSPTAKCGLHNHWRSVRQEDAEQCRIRTRTPVNAGIRYRKIFLRCSANRVERSNTPLEIFVVAGVFIGRGGSVEDVVLPVPVETPQFPL